MNPTMRSGIIAVVLLVIIIVLATVFGRGSTVTTAPQPINTVTFSCDAGQAIAAVFYDGPTTPPAGPDQPPTPGGNVNLILSDGRTMTLNQTISADGARYANADESFVFWNKGNGAIVQENGQDSGTYTNCVAATSTAQTHI